MASGVPKGSAALRMNGDLAGRTAVLLDRHPMWLEGLERLIEEMGSRGKVWFATHGDVSAWVVG